MKFDKKVAVITGAGQGIGRAIAREFASEGAYVVVADIDREAGEENVKYILEQGSEAFFIQTDVAIEADVARLAESTAEKYGGIDILVNNAGIGRPGSMSEKGMEIWDRVIAVNLRGTFMCAKYCAPFIEKRGGGCIINIASTRAFMSEPGTEPYSASKGGIIALTHSLAISLGSSRIRVNSISPGWIETSEWKKDSAAAPAIHSEPDRAQHPAGRVGIPGDIAKACAFLCSDDADFITGANLTIDGGMTVKMIYV